MTLQIGSFFSGIGGLDLGLERAGLGRTVYMCQASSEVLGDKDGYADHAVSVLRARFPGALVDTRSIEDVRLVDGEFDVIAGGFPCQDVSLAGKGAGLEGKRSGLWFAMLERIAECRPRVVVAENVAALQSRGLDDVADGLRELGYTVWASRIRAEDVGAPHRRERLLIVAVSGPPLTWPTSESAKLAVVTMQAGQEAALVVDRFGGAWTRLSRRGDRPLRWKGGSGPSTFPTEGNWWPTPVKDGRPNTSQGRTRPGLADAPRAWATPTVYGNTNAVGTGPKSGDGLATQAKAWRTPLARDGGSRGGMSADTRLAQGRQASLIDEIRAWPTPIARDWKSPSTAAKGNSRPLSEHLTGPLNPAWVECLMGFPLDWTEPAAEPEAWPGWPMPQGPEQHPYEPPRMIAPRTGKARKQRIMTLGNAVVPQVGYIAGRFAASLLEVRGV